MSSKSRQKNPNQKPRQTMSFAQMMSNEQLNALKPYIDQQVGIIAQNLSRQQLAALADLTVSITAIKRTLIKAGLTTDTDFKTLKLNIEDESYGIAETAEGAQTNDYIRASLETSYVLVDKEGKELDKQNLGSQDVEVPRLTPDSKRLLPALLEALIEMKAGETKTVNHEQTVPQGTYKITNIITVKRVSRPISKDEPTSPKGA